MKELIENPGVEDRLHAEPGKIRTFVEECLRLQSPTFLRRKGDQEIARIAREIAEFDAALEAYQAEKAITHLVLDLRSPQAQAEFSIASRILSRGADPIRMAQRTFCLDPVQIGRAHV